MKKQIFPFHGESFMDVWKIELPHDIHTLNLLRRDWFLWHDILIVILVWVSEHWKKFPREVVECLLLEIFTNLWICALGWPCLSGEVGADDHCGPFQPYTFCGVKRPCVGFSCCSTAVTIANILHIIIKKDWQCSACGVPFNLDDRTITCLGNQYLSNDKACQIDRTHLKLLP